MLYDVHNITWDTLRSPRVFWFFLHRIRYVHVEIHYLNHQLIEIFEFKYKQGNIVQVYVRSSALTTELSR